eukprot:241466-Prymnesium_polylepis.1
MRKHQVGVGDPHRGRLAQHAPLQDGRQDRLECRARRGLLPPDALQADRYGGRLVRVEPDARVVSRNRGYPLSASGGAWGRGQ